jgi:hypothetical protein
VNGSRQVGDMFDSMCRRLDELLPFPVATWVKMPGAQCATSIDEPVRHLCFTDLDLLVAFVAEHGGILRKELR